MTTLKMEIDLSELYDDEMGIEEVLAATVSRAMVASFKSRALELVTEKTDKMIQAAIEYAIEKKLSTLMEEPVAITDKWGKKVFVGSAEDYLKKEIDDRILKPVGNDGKPTSNCTVGAERTWITWSVDQILTKEIDKIKLDVGRKAENYLAWVAKQELEKITLEATRKSISSAISKTLAG